MNIKAHHEHVGENFKLMFERCVEQQIPKIKETDK